MFRCVLCLALCLVCAPAFGATIFVTDEQTIGPDVPLDTYYVWNGGHLTVDGSQVERMVVASGGQLNFASGSVIGETLISPNGIGDISVNISGGTFNAFRVINAPMDIAISGGNFTKGLTFDDSGSGGGTITVTGGRHINLSLRGIGSTWTAHVHGGEVVGAGGTAGNSIHVYGHRLRYETGEIVDGNRVFKTQLVDGVLEDGTPFSWFGASHFNPDYPQPANVYTLHELGFHLPGDTDDDGSIDIADLNNVRNFFGSDDPTGDGDRDGDTDIDDLNLVRNRFGTAAPESQPVPEPSTFVMGLAGLALAGTLGRCRRWWSPRRCI